MVVVVVVDESGEKFSFNFRGPTFICSQLFLLAITTHGF
jgi:hypothetical protein